VFDAGIVSLECLSRFQNGYSNNLVTELVQSGAKIWLSTGQVGEMLSQIQKQLGELTAGDRSKTARHLLKKFAVSCEWLSVLVEDVSSLEDDDPIAAGLVSAASRLDGRALIVTDIASRLDQGSPFVQLEKVQNLLKLDQSIRFIDLDTQQNLIRPQLEGNLHRILYHGQYVMGPEIARLESRLAEYVGSDYCVCVSSGTDALLIAMMSLEISPGDEVITTPFTFFATVEIITLLGAKPIYVDIDQHTYTLDPSLVEAAISDRTKAILPVSLYGQCPDMDRISEIASSYQIPIVEDAAQSFGATYKGRKSCNLGQIGCTSFFPAKPLGAYGDAGACFTQDSQLAERIREIRDHGQSGRYEHVRMGINGRMDTLQAAVLLAKLDILDEELDSRAQIAKMYSALLKPVEVKELVTLPNLEPHNVSSWAQYTIEVSERSRVQSSLFEKGIPTAIHYPEPVYTQLALRESVAHCPVTDRAAKRVLSLPMHPYLSIETQELVVDSLNQSLQC
jgi:UDP-2-acetamido-2-deoxy-ribo-hexuluronate aminotransferase